MSGIMTVTFNPCIDKSFDTEALSPDRKLRCSVPKLEPGGGGINVARAVHRLGGKATAVYPSGGYHGSILTEMLRMEGVDIFPVPMLADIRENLNVRETGTNRQYRFIEPGPVLTEHTWTKCIQALQALDKGGILVVSGSLPQEAPADLWRRIKELAGKKQARLVVDARGNDLRAALEAGVFLVKPNAGELEGVAKALGLAAGTMDQMARAIVLRGLAEVVVVSLGAGGVWLVTRDINKEIKAPEVPRQSSVGAGDSLVAGIVVGLGRGMDITEAVRYGVACGAAAVMNPGTELCHKKDVEALYAKMRAATAVNAPAISN